MTENENFKMATVEEAIADFKQGKFVIVVDDPGRENEGDLITSAEMITEEKEENRALTSPRLLHCRRV